MKVICKKLFNQEVSDAGITIGKSYQVLGSGILNDYYKDKTGPERNGLYYTIINDKNKIQHYNKDWFYPIEEIRQDKLDKILK